MWFLASRTKISHLRSEEFPFVTILIPAHNEEKYIGKKLDSIVHANYPKDKIQVIVGSDNSSDKTNSIVSNYTEKYNFIQFSSFSERQGKIKLVESLVESAKHDIIIHTDANVILDVNLIKHLVSHFTNPEIGIVGARIINTEIYKDGISVQESTYVRMENFLKNWEGKVLGTMMGAFGGCFAMRKELMDTIPENFIVDDFYLTFRCMEKGYKSIYDLNAKCFEDVSNHWKEEFRRKVRISIGNYQNLFYFRKWLIKPFSKIGFTFISHKVLRWVAWFLILTSFFSAQILAFSSTFFTIIALGFWISFLMLIVDRILNYFQLDTMILRFNFHFHMMNLALAIGYFKYLKGVNSNIWTPTKRN